MSTPADATKERSLLLRYATERIARSIYKGSYRHRARLMEKAAIVTAVCSVADVKRIRELLDEIAAKGPP